MAYWWKQGSIKLKQLSIGKSWQSANTCAIWCIEPDGSIWNGLPPSGTKVTGSLDRLRVGYCWWSATQPETWGYSGNTLYRWSKSHGQFLSMGNLPSGDTPVAIAVGLCGIFVLGTGNAVVAGSQMIYMWWPTNMENPTAGGSWVTTAWGLDPLTDLCTGYLSGPGTITWTLTVLLGGTTAYWTQWQPQGGWSGWTQMPGTIASLNGLCADGPVGLDSSGNPYQWPTHQWPPAAGSSNLWEKLTSQPPAHVPALQPTLKSIVPQYDTAAHGIDADNQLWIWRS